MGAAVVFLDLGGVRQRAVPARTWTQIRKNTFFPGQSRKFTPSKSSSK